MVWLFNQFSQGPQLSPGHSPQGGAHFDAAIYGIDLLYPEESSSPN